MLIVVNSSKEFNERVQGTNGLVVVDFTASWCGPCQRIAPCYNQLAKENPGVLFLKVDVDDCADIAKFFKVTGMPTFLFIKSGKTVHRFSGANTQELLASVKAYR